MGSKQGGGGAPNYRGAAQNRMGGMPSQFGQPSGLKPQQTNQPRQQTYRDAQGYFVNNMRSAAPDENDPSTWFGGAGPSQPAGGPSQLPAGPMQGPRGGGGKKQGGRPPQYGQGPGSMDLERTQGPMGGGQNAPPGGQKQPGENWFDFHGRQGQQQSPGMGGGWGPPPPRPQQEGPMGMPFQSGGNYMAPYGRGGYFNQPGQAGLLGMYGSPRPPQQDFGFPEPYAQPEAGTGYGGADRNPFANMPGYGSSPFSQFDYMNQGPMNQQQNRGYFGAF